MSIELKKRNYYFKGPFLNGSVDAARITFERPNAFFFYIKKKKINYKERFFLTLLTYCICMQKHIYKNANNIGCIGCVPSPPEFPLCPLPINTCTATKDHSHQQRLDFQTAQLTFAYFETLCK